VSVKVCDVEQREPSTFSRVAITLGIGPHSTFNYNYVKSEAIWVIFVNEMRIDLCTNLLNVSQHIYIICHLVLLSSVHFKLLSFSKTKIFLQ